MSGARYTLSNLHSTPRDMSLPARLCHLPTQHTHLATKHCNTGVYCTFLKIGMYACFDEDIPPVENTGYTHTHTHTFFRDEINVL